MNEFYKGRYKEPKLIGYRIDLNRWYYLILQGTDSEEWRIDSSVKFNCNLP